MRRYRAGNGNGAMIEAHWIHTYVERLDTERKEADARAEKLRVEADERNSRWLAMYVERLDVERKEADARAEKLRLESETRAEKLRFESEARAEKQRVESDERWQEARNELNGRMDNLDKKMDMLDGKMTSQWRWFVGITLSSITITIAAIGIVVGVITYMGQASRTAQPPSNPAPQAHSAQPTEPAPLP